jgi:hypothetical protein
MDRAIPYAQNVPSREAKSFSFIGLAYLICFTNQDRKTNLKGASNKNRIRDLTYF